MYNSLSAVPHFSFHSSCISRPGEISLIVLLPTGYPDVFEVWRLKFKHFQVPGLHDFMGSFMSSHSSTEKRNLPETLRKVLRTGNYNLYNPGKSSLLTV